MSAEKLKGIRVSHKKFGTGRIAGFQGELMEITFRDGMVKKFKYPDAFDRFLKLEEQDHLEEIRKEIEAGRLDEDYQARVNSRQVYEHIQEFGEKRRAHFEKKAQEQIEKQRRMQKMREQKFQNSLASRRVKAN